MGAPRPMSDAEIKSLLASDVVGHLATIDGDGYPHVTSLWFRWDGDVALVDDANGQWTTVVTDRYLNGPGAAERIKHRQRQNRTVIELRPIEIIAGASTPAQHS
jgi:hypothetical protein